MLPEEGFIRWLLWAWERLLRLEGGTEDFRRRRRLVVPVAENFPVDPGLEGHDLADDYFLFVKEHAGVQGWPLELVPEDGWADDDDLGVPYDPCLLGTPTRLVAQLAHGVAHQVVLAHGIGDLEENEVDPLADATAVFLGFGIFAANAAARVAGPQSWLGPTLAPVGALSEHEVAYALALYAVLTEIPDRHVEAHLRPNPREFYRRAVKHILRYRGRELHRLRQVPLAPLSPYR
ncbi:MAG: hypothetical protein CMN30_15385 [Sandaracinus sp.]|nr:hypothetical protein [Sandaracinus sp.]